MKSRTHLLELTPYGEPNLHGGDEAGRELSKRSFMQSSISDWCDNSLLSLFYSAKESQIYVLYQTYGQQNGISIKCPWLIDTFDKSLNCMDGAMYTFIQQSTSILFYCKSSHNNHYKGNASLNSQAITLLSLPSHIFSKVKHLILYKRLMSNAPFTLKCILPQLT